MLYPSSVAAKAAGANIKQKNAAVITTVVMVLKSFIIILSITFTLILIAARTSWRANL